MDILQSFRQAVNVIFRPDSSPWQIDVVESTGSTNTELAARVRQGHCRAFTALVALEQTAARGRLTRSWSAPLGSSISLSMALPLKDSHWGLIPLATGVAVAHALAGFGVEAGLKWPNDVQIAGKKVCGILAEVALDLVVVGVGVNLSQTAEQLGFPDATSLALAGANPTREQVVAAILAKEARTHALLASTAGVDRLLDTYRTLCVTLGQTVRIQLDETNVIEGQACGIAPDGQLLVEVDGATRSFASGDVYHLRSGSATGTHDC